MRQEQIVDCLSYWEKCGLKISPNGDVIYGAPDGERYWGWLHSVFSPVPKIQRNNFGHEQPFIKEFQYWEELQHYNGVNLFAEGLFLLSLRLEGAETQAKAWDIVLHNLNCRQTTAKFPGLIIGGANFETRSVDYLQQKDGRILAVETEEVELVREWDNFERFFIGEMNRLNSKFESGQESAPDYCIL